MTLADHLTVWLKGETDAIQFILEIHKIFETWDDLIDQDKLVSGTDISAAFYSALLTLPRNTFYRRYFEVLSPLVETAIIDWHTANLMQARNQGDDLRTAYVIRCSAQAITSMCARIICGIEWAVNVNLEMRSLGDTWAEYSLEFGVK